MIGWCALVPGLRRLLGHPLPSMLLLSAGLLCGRAALALVLSSALVYVPQPVFGSALLGMLFLGSAAIGRPITMRLAHDFVSLPAHLPAHDGIRRLFTRVAVVWGVSRLLDAAMSLGLLHWGLGFGLVTRPFFSGLLSALTIAVCAAWSLPHAAPHARREATPPARLTSASGPFGNAGRWVASSRAWPHIAVVPSPSPVPWCSS